MNIKHQTSNILLAAALLLGGCSMSSQERIDAAKQVQLWLEQSSGMIDQALVAARGVVAQAKADLSDPNISDATRAEYTKTLDKAERELAVIVDRKKAVDQGLEVVGRIVKHGPTANADLGDELQIVGGVLVGAGQAAGGDVGLWLKIAGGIMGVLALGWGGKKIVQGKK